MQTILGTAGIIIFMGYWVWKWDKQRKRDLIRETTIQPPDDENSYS